MSSEGKGLMFVIFSVIAGISAFLPVIRIESTLRGKTEVETLKLISSVWGIIFLVAAGLCVFMVFTGMKEKCGFGAAILFIIGLVTGFRCYVTKDRYIMLNSDNGLGLIIEEITGTGTSATADMAWGFYVFIIATILATFSGVWYTMSKD